MSLSKPSKPPTAPFAHLVFYESRIAGNTGAAIRLAACTGARLHLIEPLGFDLSEPKLRRAGLDYHDLAVLEVHKSFEAFLVALRGSDGRSPHGPNGGTASRIYAYETTATTSYTEITYHPGDVLLFGPEPTALPDAVLSHPAITARVRIPMLAGRRSLNLANAAAIATYEAWRQQGFGPTAPDYRRGKEHRSSAKEPVGQQAPTAPDCRRSNKHRGSA